MTERVEHKLFSPAGSGGSDSGNCFIGEIQPSGLSFALSRFQNCRSGKREDMIGVLWTIIVVLFFLWLIGFLLHVGGGLIHLLLVVVLILVIYNLITGRGARV
jgi:hypothetical protein